MVFVGLWIFTSGLTHVHLTSSASQLKRKMFLQIFSFSVQRSYGEDGYRRKGNDCTLSSKTYQTKTLKSFRQGNCKTYISFDLRKLRRVHHHSSLSNAPHVFVHGMSLNGSSTLQRCNVLRKRR